MGKKMNDGEKCCGAAKTFELVGAQSSPGFGGQIGRAAVFGAGIMGQGISQVLSSNGISVLLFDHDTQLVEKGLAMLSKSMDQEIARWALTDSEKRSILARIEKGKLLEDVKKCQVVIETISEDITAKQNLLRELDMYASQDTVFMTNTDSLSITEIASATRREHKVIGVHFIYPVSKVSLVEIVRGKKTSQETVEFAKTLVGILNKTPLEVSEHPGFITTRLIVPLLNEAMQIYMDGIASAEDIDKAMKAGFGLITGPLKLADQIGLDEVLIWTETLYKKLEDAKFRPCLLLQKLVRAGQLGVKTGKGFYTYS
jgi:3-hydroxybutyryl-CoA dehydrogenase